MESDSGRFSVVKSSVSALYSADGFYAVTLLQIYLLSVLKCSTERMIRGGEKAQITGNSGLLESSSLEPAEV